jgi:hypothetical protein
MVETISCDGKLRPLAILKMKGLPMWSRGPSHVSSIRVFRLGLRWRVDRWPDGISGLVESGLYFDARLAIWQRETQE